MSNQQVLDVIYSASVKFSQSLGVSRYAKDGHCHCPDEAYQLTPSIKATKPSLRWVILKRKNIRFALEKSPHWRYVVTALAEAVCFNPGLILQENDERPRSRLYVLVGSDEHAFPELTERCKGSISSIAAVHMHHDHTEGRNKALVCSMHGQFVQYLVDNAFFSAPPPPPSFILWLWRGLRWSETKAARTG